MDIKKISRDNKVYLLRIVIILIYLISAYTIVSVFPSGYITLQTQPTITVVPASASIVKGTPVVVAITVSNYQNFYAYQFDINYNRSILNFKGVTFSDALGEIATGQAFCIPTSNLLTTSGNVRNIACTRTIPGGLNGSAAIANLAFDTIGTGTSNIVVSNSLLVSADMQSISHSIVNSSVSVVKSARTPRTRK
jgi:hypothetical protein